MNNRTITFKAAALTNEINLNKIAKHFGITRKFQWEDSLFLDEATLKGVLVEPSDKLMLLFSFGSIVFINFEHHEILDGLRYLSSIEKSLSGIDTLAYTDDYSLEISQDTRQNVSNDNLFTSELKPYHQEIVATVLAKSVALEKIEVEIDDLLDEIEDTIGHMRKGMLTASDRKLAKTSSKILGFRLSTLSSIMLLDKPEITWNNEEAEALYMKLASMLELSDRYENMRHKTEMLMDITQVFTGLAHNQRGNRLEWAIIILIAFDIMMSIFEKVLG